MKLSLCIAAYNEESNIHYPLDSAYDMVEEVILVDGGSSDKTVEIAKSYGSKVKVFIEKNPKMFHINKQKAIEKAKGEWILQLDADEALSDDLKEEIRNIVAVGGSRERVPDGAHVRLNRTSTGGNETTDRIYRDVAYWIPRKNWFLSRFLTKGGQYPDYTIRLYRNGVAKFPCRDVHENVEIVSPISIPSENEGSPNIGYLKNPILHYADPNFARYIKRWHRYNDLEADMLVKEGKKPSFIDYCLIKPSVTFFKIYFRHLGIVDGIPGFIFAFFSSIRFVEIYDRWAKVKRQL